MNSWVSLHIFYGAGGLSELVKNCIGPLVSTARRKRMVQRYFFIRYWENGFHIRLRAQPENGVSKQVLGSALYEHVQRYLHHNPSLYPSRESYMNDYFVKMYEVEYGRQALIERYGPDCKIPLERCDTIKFVEYIPEIDRYGGLEGLSLSEQHFEESSDTVIGCLSALNYRVPTVLFGTSLQLMYVLAYSMLDSHHEICEFLSNYAQRWGARFLEDFADRAPIYERLAKRQAEKVGRQVDRLQKMCHGHGTTSQLIERWASHSRELRAKLDVLAASDNIAGPTPESSDVDIRKFLLGSYIHMTNNRLGVTIPDEVYIAILLREGVRSLL